MAVRGACLDKDSIHAWALGALEEEAAAAFEIHMASCDDCASRAGELLVEEAQWNAAAHGEAWRRERIAIAIAAAVQNAAAEVRTAFEAWGRKGAAFATGTLRAAKAGLVPEDFLPQSISLDPIALRGTVATRGPEPIHVPMPDGKAAVVSRDEADIVVTFPGRAEDAAAVAILVIPEAEGEDTRYDVARWDSVRHRWIARIAAPSGDFRVVVGPG